MTPTPRQIDITCDLGESFGVWKLGRDEEVAPYITSANVACGFHAGDPSVMRETVRRCREHGVVIGAHFGFPDLRGFGRRALKVDPSDLINDILYQMGALAAICRAERVDIAHAKPHGALDDMAAQDAQLAAAVVEAVAIFDDQMPIYTVGNSEIYAAARTRGLPAICQIYVDRAVDGSGTEIPGYDRNRLGGSVAAAVDRVMAAVRDGRLSTTGGTTLAWQIDAICFHGDTEDALQYARGLTEGLHALGVTVSAPRRKSAVPA